MVAKASAAVTNASWSFPTTINPAPSQPIAANLAIYSTNDVLGWTSANANLNVTYVLHATANTALEFSYNGNHSAYLNGSTLTLTATISGVPTGHGLSDIQISYDTRWNKTTSTVTETWDYSINGGAYINFDLVAATGNTWQAENIVLSGLTLHDGDTIIFRNTFSGVTGNSGSLDFDNFEITTEVVPEPSALLLIALSFSIAGLRLFLRAGQIR
jgi:hypothetical protein